MGAAKNIPPRTAPPSAGNLSTAAAKRMAELKLAEQQARQSSSAKAPKVSRERTLGKIRSIKAGMPGGR